MLLRFFVRPLKSLKFGKVLAALIPVLLLWCFCAYHRRSRICNKSGNHVYFFLQLGLALARKNAGIQGVWVSFVILLLVNPRFIFDVGFQLSYAAVFWNCLDDATLATPIYKATQSCSLPR